jgi:SH3-like domain-containing protein
MKKRIFALILAGLMTASMVSCVVEGSNSDTGDTESNQHLESTADKPTINPPAVTWQDVDKTVYATSDIKLRSEASSASATIASIPKEAEMHCTRTSAAYSYVEYNGQSGYVLNSYITDVDILGKNFTPVEGGEKVMYSNSNSTNVRLYPSKEDFSSIKGGYKLNDAVTVIATNGTWFKIKYLAKDGTFVNYYVHNSCLSADKVEDPNDDSKYESNFTDVAGTPVMYVSVTTVYFRKAPNQSAEAIMSLSKGNAVTVLKTGTVEGRVWNYVVVEIPPQKEGDGPTYQRGYISADCLSETTGAMTLDRLLELYPTFTKVDKTMYVLKESSINVRSTPTFPDDDANLLLTVTSGKTPDTIKPLKVVASGVYGENDAAWVIIEYTEGTGDNKTTAYGFVRANQYLTSNANGEATVTLDDLLIKYPEFKILETPVTATTKSIANCYATPDANSSVVKKLDAGVTVTLVAQQNDEYASWCVVKDADGNYYFVNITLLNK